MEIFQGALLRTTRDGAIIDTISWYWHESLTLPKRKREEHVKILDGYLSVLRFSLLFLKTLLFGSKYTRDGMTFYSREGTRHHVGMRNEHSWAVEPIFLNKKLNLVTAPLYGRACARASAPASSRPLYGGLYRYLLMCFSSVCAEWIRNFCKATEPKEWHRFRFSAVYMRNTIRADQVDLLMYSFMRVY